MIWAIVERCAGGSRLARAGVFLALGIGIPIVLVSLWLEERIAIFRNKAPRQ